MKLIYFLLRSSWLIVLVAIVTGFVSGGSSASLIALISRTVSRSATSSSVVSIVLSFIGLAIIALISSIISQVVLIRLSQDAVFQLRMHLSRQILSSELTHLEELGTSRLLATLTEDVEAVSNAVFLIPFLCIDMAIVVGCLSYLAWLSWAGILMLLGFLVVAIGSCQRLLKSGGKLLALAREEQDILFSHFRSLTSGSKELKLHYQRRQVFLSQELQSAAASFRRHNVHGLTLFAITSSWGKLLFFFAVGFVLFALPHLIAISPQTLSSYILIFVYFMQPMDSIVNDLPILRGCLKSRVCCKKALSVYAVNR